MFPAHGRLGNKLGSLLNFETKSEGMIAMYCINLLLKWWNFSPRLVKMMIHYYMHYQLRLISNADFCSVLFLWLKLVHFGYSAIQLLQGLNRRFHHLTSLASDSTVPVPIAWKKATKKCPQLDETSGRNRPFPRFGLYDIGNDFEQHNGNNSTPISHLNTRPSAYSIPPSWASIGSKQ